MLEADHILSGYMLRRMPPFHRRTYLRGNPQISPWQIPRTQPVPYPEKRRFGAYWSTTCGSLGQRQQRLTSSHSFAGLCSGREED